MWGGCSGGRGGGPAPPRLPPLISAGITLGLQAHGRAPAAELGSEEGPTSRETRPVGPSLGVQAPSVVGPKFCFPGGQEQGYVPQNLQQV